jgi:hypothetical protein
MPGRSNAAASAPIVGIIAAVVFAGTLASAWVEQRLTRTVGDVAVDEMLTTTGMELVPLGVVAGLTAVVCGVVVLVTRGVARRVAAVLLAASGGGLVVTAGLGAVRATAMEGRITPAPWAAGLSALVAVAAGALAWGSTGRRMPARYDVDPPPDDREWQMAADPGDARHPDEPAS